MNISFIIEKKRLLLILLPLLLLFQSCNNDLFIDRDFMEVSVSETLLAYNGGRSVVTFKSPNDNDLPYISVGRESPSTGTYEMYKNMSSEDGKYVFGDGFFYLTADYDRHSGEVSIDLHYNAYTDTLNVYISRYISSLSVSQSAKIRVEPSAVPSEITNISYIDNATPISGLSKTETVNIQMVNILDQPVEYYPFKEYVALAKGYFKPEYLYEMDIFGEHYPTVPVVIDNNSLGVKIDSELPYSLDPNVIPGVGLPVEEPSALMVPARCLCEIKLTVRFSTYGFPYFANYVNSELKEVDRLGFGKFFLEMPERYMLSVKNYDLETGEEL